MSRPGTTCLAVAALAAMHVVPALPGVPVAAAQPAPPARQLPLWELGVGVAGLSLPHYRGAEHSRHWVLPTPYAVYRGEVLRANRDGVKAMLFDTDRVDLDLSLAATAPSRSADEPARHGMPDLKATVEFGPNLNLRLARGPGWRFELRLPVRAAYTVESSPRSIGWIASPNLAFDAELGGWNLGAQLAVPYGSRRLNAYFYDVAPAYADASRPAYRADGGRLGWQGTFGVSRRFDRRWFGAFVRTDSLGGSPVTNSPLVRRTHGLSFGVAYSWILWQSDRLVPDRDALR